MKKETLSLLLFGVATLATMAGENLSPETKIFLDSDTNADDPAHVTVTEWYVLPEDLDKLPPCDPATEDTPVSLKKALVIAQADLQKNVKNPEKWRLDSVEFHQIDLGDSGITVPESWTDQKPTNRWFFKVIFTKPVESQDIATNHYAAPYWAFVLMDGSIAAHRTRPQTKEEIDSGQQFFQGMANAVNAAKKTTK
ncbi:MAG TPA: hypothetical protein VGZ93_01255 [Candidatus Methylacidiphilales bacterium]|jgi:hypothetical protein|nr:hypothetical protein [Candidatus Methylacidiphilales bacterium]